MNHRYDSYYDHTYESETLFAHKSYYEIFILNSQYENFILNSQYENFIQNSQYESFIQNSQYENFIRNSQHENFILNSQYDFLTNKTTLGNLIIYKNDPIKYSCIEQAYGMIFTWYNTELFLPWTFSHFTFLNQVQEPNLSPLQIYNLTNNTATLKFQSQNNKTSIRRTIYSDVLDNDRINQLQK